MGYGSCDVMILDARCEQTRGERGPPPVGRRIAVDLRVREVRASVRLRRPSGAVVPSMKVLRFINDQTYTQVITLGAKGASPSGRATDIKADRTDVKRALPSNQTIACGEPAPRQLRVPGAIPAAGAPLWQPEVRSR